MTILEAILKVIELILSWPVICLVITGLLYRQVFALIQQLAPSVKSLQAGSVSIERFEPKTAETIAGTTNYSNTPIPFPDDSLVFRSNSLGFEIEYPSSTEWKANTDSASLNNSEIARSFPGRIFGVTVMPSDPERSFFNVNVLLDPIGDITLNAYLAQSVVSCRSIGGTVEYQRLDQDSHSGMLVWSMPVLKFLELLAPSAEAREREKEKLSKLSPDLESAVFLSTSRFTLKNGFAFLATAVQLKEFDANLGDLVKDLGRILNSFNVTR
jgi:hypothetical protein